MIRPRSGWIGIDWREMWSHRELLGFLIWREFSVRYKQTVLGSAWAILQPVIMMAIFSVIFGRFAKIDSEGFPYPVFVFAGLIPWTLFSQGMPQSALSLVNQQQLLTKVYFPRLFVPIAAAAVFVVDLLISLAIYAARAALLRRGAELGDRLAGASDSADDDRHAVHRCDAGGAHGLLSRLQTRRPVPDADPDVRHARDLSRQAGWLSAGSCSSR